jgi:lactate dehydrogenase-like 2-hydroxyacid dehydrogenase
LTTSDVPITEVAAQATGADAILTCPGDNFDVTLVAAVPSTVKVIAIHSFGYDHIDVVSVTSPLKHGGHHRCRSVSRAPHAPPPRHGAA